MKPTTTKFIAQLIEKAKRPGLLGIAGLSLSKRCRDELRVAFKAFGIRLADLPLTSLLNGDVASLPHAVHAALYNPLRILRPQLQEALKKHLISAIQLASKLNYKEADDGDPVDPPVYDKLGPTGFDAAKWAEEYAAQLVVDISQTTEDQIAAAISKGIETQVGVPGTSRLIRDAVDDIEKRRADMIATTEMNRAMSKAALDKMLRIGVEYKEIILAEDACEICQSCADEDPLPIDELYNTGDDGPPFHPNCKCAVTGSRGPDDEEE